MLMSVHLVVSGRVQGVWFRAGTREQALQRGLCGWVKNCSNGTVEIHAEGEKEALEHFIDWCRKGPPGALVTALDIEWVVSQCHKNFEIH